MKVKFKVTEATTGSEVSLQLRRTGKKLSKLYSERIGVIQAMANFSENVIQENINIHQIMEMDVEEKLTGDEIVISGISGLFPRSKDVLQFEENLINKVDMIEKDDSKWSIKDPELSSYVGDIQNKNELDAAFFRISYTQASSFDPMCSKILEQAYGAIYDAGVNPVELKGKKVGVFVSIFYCDYGELSAGDINKGFIMTGTAKTMIANRISYWLDLKGPSYAIDTECAGSISCLEFAYNRILSGEIDAAIVGGCSNCTHPNLEINLRNAGRLCLDGKTKSFDMNGDGYVRSEAAGLIFLQKAKDAKRIYAEVYHAKGKYFVHSEDKIFPAGKGRELPKFLQEFYSEINVLPKDVEYIEGNGVGIAKIDEIELKAISEVFANENDIKIGCIKSNMGNAESASGICALVKMCLSYHNGTLPGNLHYNEPQDHISAVRDGRIKIVTENTPFKRGFTAINTMSFTGNNYHALLKGHYKPKNNERYMTSIPYLIPASGRLDIGINNIFDKLEKQPIDPEQIALLHGFYIHNSPGHTARGYTIIDRSKENKPINLGKGFDIYQGHKYPVWFLYSGMGSQWTGMATELMRIPIFSAAIERCRNVLEPKGVDLIKILTDSDETIYDNILNSFVGIAAVQIGLTDILREIGIVADNFIGHSVGELGCAYADGCLTAEETIMAAYYRGLVSVETKFIHGAMAAVGLSRKAILPMCPPEIVVACYNSFESCTISGPADDIHKFVAELTSRGIFAKFVKTSNIAYHSKYVAAAGPGHLAIMEGLIKDPKPRSQKWIATSVPQEKWDDPVAKYCSAEYFTGNMLNPVYFEDAAKLIPSNAIVIEIAPHGLLQAIVKRSHTRCKHIPLAYRKHSDPVRFLLEAIGKLYLAGLNPHVHNLYPKVEFPVSSETALLSNFVLWDNTEKLNVLEFQGCDIRKYVGRECVISLHDDDYIYLKDHIRDDVIVFPEAATLVLVWQTFAMHLNVDFRELSIVFKNIEFHSEVYISSEEPIKLKILIPQGTNNFEVSSNGLQVCSGHIDTYYTLFKCGHKPQVDLNENDYHLPSQDIYNLMRTRGYGYKGKFQSILSSNVTFDEAQIKWTGDWVTFIDSLLQINAFSRGHNGVSSPKIIMKMTINCIAQNKISPLEIHGNKYYTVNLKDMAGVTKCAGVNIENIGFDDKPRTVYQPDVLQTREFYPYFNSNILNIQTALHIILQIVADNGFGDKITVTEFTPNAISNMRSVIKDIAGSIQFTTIEVEPVRDDNDLFKVLSEEKSTCNVIIVYDLLQDEKKILNLYNIFPSNTFLITIEKPQYNINELRYKYFTNNSVMKTENNYLSLLSKTEKPNPDVSYITVNDNAHFSWITQMHEDVQKGKRVVLIADNQLNCGLLGFVTTLRRDNFNIGLVTVRDEGVKLIDPKNKIFDDQLKKNMTINIFKEGEWGSYYYLPAKLFSTVQNVYLTTRPTDLGSLVWAEAAPIPAEKISVKVHYAGLSLKDYENLVEVGYKKKHTFGNDFSGLNNRGQRVMGVISKGAISSSVEADPDLLWPVPDHWSLEDAATVPLPYLHAFYCLNLGKVYLFDSSIFIIGGAGALGQALISICLALNFTIYTVVSNMDKKNFLLRMFPQLNENNIDISSNEDFKWIINGSKLPMLVISCASDPLRQKAMKWVHKYGGFLDICDGTQNKELGMAFLDNEKTYVYVILSNIFKPELLEEKKMLQLMVTNGISKGFVRPLSRVIYSPEDISRAFRLFSRSSRIGRVLVKIDNFNSQDHGTEILTRFSPSPKGSHVIFCGDNVLGIQLADWLVKRGVKKVVINTTINLSVYENDILKAWKKYKAAVVINSSNVQNYENCEKLLKSAEKLGSIEGIFIVNDNNSKSNDVISAQDYLEATVKKSVLLTTNLDSASRNICKDLRYFAIITSGSTSIVNEYVASACETICQERNGRGLPGLILRSESLNELDTNAAASIFKSNPYYLSVYPEYLSYIYKTTFDALETSLRYNFNNVLTFKMKKYFTNYLDEISKAIGIESLDDIDGSVTLKDMNIRENNSGYIRRLIQRGFKVDIPTQQLLRTSIDELKQVCSVSKKDNTRFSSGLAAFYNHVMVDEWEATENIIPMITLLNSIKQKHWDPNNDDTYLLMLPGFDENHQILSEIGERLKIEAVSLQVGPDYFEYDIPEMAELLLKRLEVRRVLKQKFYILGYSFGVNLALALAALLEKKGHVGVVYCLDSSPDALRIHLNAYLGGLEPFKFQDRLIAHVYHVMSGQDSNDLIKDLETVETWSEKTEIFISKLKVFGKYTFQYMKFTLETAYRRFMMALEYEPDFKLDSQLVLMKGIPHPDAEGLPDDYNLSKYTKQPVKVFDIQSDHVEAPHDSRVANIVNRMLDPKLLDKFKKQNLCEKYNNSKKKLFY